eukprot:XP_001709883.1 Hypothetical protein GL50803_23333 [Giardia lamblia ATCC 50803]
MGTVTALRHCSITLQFRLFSSSSVIVQLKPPVMIPLQVIGQNFLMHRMTATPSVITLQSEIDA